MPHQASPTMLARPPRWRRVVAVAVLIAATATGCATYPGTAARLNGASFSQDALVQQGTDVISEAKAPALTDPMLTGLHRQILTRFIRHQLITTAARDHSISITDAQVNDFLQKNGRQNVATTLLVPMSEVGPAARDLLTLQGLVQTATKADLAVTDVRVAFDEVSVASQDEAQARVRTYRANPDAMIAAGATTGAASLLTDISTAPWGMFAAAPGQLVVVPTPNGGPVSVRRIINRSTTASSLSNVPQTAATNFSDSYNLAALLLKPYAASAGIVVNPRYGVWDPLTVQVIPTPAGA